MAGPDQKRRITISSALLLLLAVVLVPAVLLVGYTCYMWYASRLANEEDRNLELARDLAADVCGLLLDVRHQEEALSLGLSLLKPQAPEEANRLLKAMADASDPIRTLFMTDAYGVIIASSVSGSIGTSVSDRPYFRDIAGGKDWSVSDLLASRLTGDFTFVVACGIRDGGTLRNVMAAEVDSPKASHLLNMNRVPRGDLVVFDSKGVVIMSEPDTKLMPESQAIRDGLLREALAGREAVGDLPGDASEKPRIGARAPIAGTGWVAGASRDRAEVLAPVMHTLKQALGMTALVVLLSCSIAFLLGRRIVRDVRMLREHALAIGSGHTEHRADMPAIAELRYLGVAFDDAVGERERAEKALAHERANLEAIFDAVHVGMLLVDEKGAIKRVNEVVTRWVGKDTSTMLGTQPGEGLNCVHVVDEAARCGQTVHCPECPIRNTLESVLRSGEPIHEVETKTVLSVGGQQVRLWLSVSADPVVIDGRRHVILALNNITARKQAEQHLQQTAMDLARSNQDLEQFAYIASHDLQEPLRVVAGYLQLIEQRYKGQLSPDADEFIEFAVDGAKRMQQLIADLLAYSRVGTRGQEPEPTDCNEVLRKTLAHLEFGVADSGATVICDPLPTVRADAKQLAQLFQNLISNAIKFRGPEPLKITVSAQAVEGQWQFAVADNGIGIEPQYFDRVFQVFQRLHSRAEYPGTGIGLSICKRIVERHGGRIWVESQPGRGSTFYFTIPGEPT